MNIKKKLKKRNFLHLYAYEEDLEADKKRREEKRRERDD